MRANVDKKMPDLEVLRLLTKKVREMGLDREQMAFSLSPGQRRQRNLKKSLPSNESS